MNRGALFPLAAILAICASLLLHVGRRAGARLVGMVADGITRWRLTQIEGSRARANRIIRAVELETRTNALIPLARSPLWSEALARALGRSARFDQGVPTKKLTVGSVTR